MDEQNYVIQNPTEFPSGHSEVGNLDKIRADLLKSSRLEQSLSYDEFAEMVCIDADRLQRIETYQEPLSATEIEIFCYIKQVPLIDFFPLLQKGANSSMGQFVRTHRRARGLSQEALGVAIGVTKQAISKIEMGESYPSHMHLKPLAIVLSVPLTELLARRPH
ncbi:helix-turn-helix domain-containing protein [Spirosoma montaniterrae]|uniref:HTH cro/C1-type domain-containing protein n=1 Tax=Spirosoma montaniterrae TaxID=1178516 RepID=A0A1P9WRS5_9BACT|nr:helix-turn-helix transcriptional regulator [Spirosoma montaniterrae]AQG78076.1 hypothetical protein AWR27_01135 [Spirosoma montaniterrae]